MFFLIVLLALPQEETILIRNGTIVPVVGSKIENGSLLIRSGKIVKIGRNIQAPSDAKVIDAKGMYIYPGLIAPMTAIGVTGYPGTGNDLDEVGVSTPQMDPYDAINPEDDCIEVTRIGGVTTVMTGSGSRNVINGKSVVMNLEGTLAEEMVIKRYVAQIFNMGAKRRNEYPSTLPGVVSLIRDKLNQAKRYADKKKKSMVKGDKKRDPKPEEPFNSNLEMEALIPVINREVPALFITHNDVTIRNALHLIKEYNLKGILYAKADILKFTDQLVAEKIPVIWAGTMTIPKRWEPFDLNYHTAYVLSAKGVQFALDQGRWILTSHDVRNLPIPASMSMAHGLSEEEAIKAITIYPARILGIDGQVGSLEVGKTANVVIWSDSPIQMRSRVHTVIINGKIIPLTSVQTRLRDKFEKIVRERMKDKKK